MPDAPDDSLYSGYLVKGLPPPNHLLPLELPEAGKELSPKYLWPLVMAQRQASQQELESQLPNLVSVFTSTLHGDYVAGQYDRPPTWMDPHVLVALASQQPEIEELLERSWQKNDATLSKKLEPLLSDVFDRLYLAYVKHEFEHHARELIAKWMLSEYASNKVTEELAKRTPKPTTRPPAKTSRRQK